MPTEKAPNNPLSQNYVPVGGTPYRVKTGDDWQSVARTAGVDVWALIEFNFKTRNPAEVNWYLRRNVGCRRATGDNKNWMFSSDAQPGIIYLPSSSRTPVSIQSIKFWLNAFIPRYIPGYTRPVPAGKHVGKTMIPGPQSTRVPTGIPFSTVDVGISDCYLTDQRVFSNDIRAKSRMHSEVKVNFGGTSPTITEFHNCDETTEIDCEDGTVEDTGRETNRG
jgi:hypothetical protein